MSTERNVHAFLDLLATSQEGIPSLRKIRESVGGGSLTTISKAVQDWKAAKENRKSDSEFEEQLPDEDFKRICEALWSAFRPQLNARLAGSKAEARKANLELLSVQEELREARAEIQLLRSGLDALEEKLGLEREARAKAEGAYEALKAYTGKE